MLFNKNHCYDIFQSTKINGKHMYQQLPHRARIKNKLKRSKIQAAFMRFQLVDNLRCVDRILLIKIRLKLIELSKQLLNFDISLGSEVFIPKDLQQYKLPLSYLFYDPIIAIIQDRISDERNEFFFSKNSVKVEQFKSYSVKEKVINKLLKDDCKATFKYEVVNKKYSVDIDYNESDHTMALQRSQYLVIDQEVNSLIKRKPKIKQGSTGTSMGIECQETNVDILFCHQRIIGNQRQQQIVFKAAFLLKL